MERRNFWLDVVTLTQTITPLVMGRVMAFGAWGAFVWWFATHVLRIQIELGVAPYEIIGAVMALLLVLRTNSGYDRWYEGRKLWGGIVNQSRNLGVIGTSYGPNDRAWREAFVRWVVAFSHLSRHGLRGERDLSDLKGLLKPSELKELENVKHYAIYASARVAQLLRVARDQHAMDGFAYMKAEDQRCLLIDHLGACERILKTPLARVVSVKVRKFLFLFLLVLPLAIVDRSGGFTPLLTILVAFPLLSLDQIGVELENPFSRNRLSHLPLTQICETIQENLFELLEVNSEAEIEDWKDHNSDEYIAHQVPQSVS
ncbi:bestrophin family protein [Planctomicrobium sp. SH668]|uniref:bestrophin family protein n=1 Tax=Planctomicrobium sp. SH668 TaxID=3448126 RepID=UPI003F5B3191